MTTSGEATARRAAEDAFMCRPYFGEKLDFLLVWGPVCFATGGHGLCNPEQKNPDLASDGSPGLTSPRLQLQPTQVGDELLGRVDVLQQLFEELVSEPLLHGGGVLLQVLEGSGKSTVFIPP